MSSAFSGTTIYVQERGNQVGGPAGHHLYVLGAVSTGTQTRSLRDQMSASVQAISHPARTSDPFF
jgi:hypothetical protein